MLVSLKPNEDRVLMYTFATPDVTKGGLWIPGEAKSKPFTGRVVAVGPGKGCATCGTKSPMPEVGQFFVFPENAGVEIMIQGVSMRIIRAADLHVEDPDKFDPSCPELAKALEATKETGISEPIPAQQ